MDTDTLQYFNVIEAQKSLTTWRTALEVETNLNQLEDFVQNKRKGLFDVEVVRTGEPSLARLCFTDEDSYEEAIFSIQGFLVQSYLPPITSRKQLPRKPLYLTQTVYLSGFSEPVFSAASDGVVDIQRVFSDALGSSCVNTVNTPTWRGHPLFTCSNRYFTKQSLAPHEVLSSFLPEIDPKGLLLELAKSSNEPLVNIDENIVKYYERVENGNVIAFKKTLPAVFQLGDLVQADVSFVAFFNPKDKAYTIRPVLRALYLLDDSEKLKAYRKIVIPTVPNAKRSLKRKLTIIDSDDGTPNDVVNAGSAEQHEKQHQISTPEEAEPHKENESNVPMDEDPGENHQTNSSQ